MTVPSDREEKRHQITWRGEGANIPAAEWNRNEEEIVSNPEFKELTFCPSPKQPNQGK
jgi:hypothetical protein